MGCLRIAVSFEVGSLTTQWRPDQISAYYAPDRTMHLLPSMAGRSDEVLADRIREARQNRRVVFDGPSYALRDVGMVVDGTNDRETRLELLLGPTSFYQYLLSNISLATDVYSHNELSRIRRSCLPDLPLSNQLAVNFSLITSDDVLVLQRRSRQVANFSEYLANGINATVSRQSPEQGGDEDEFGLPDPILTVMRECEEELGFRPSRQAVTIYGVVVEHRYMQPILVGEVRVPRTFDAVCSEAMAWARDKYEYQSLESLTLDPGDVARSLLNDRWVPVCALTTLISLIHSHQREQIENAFDSHAVVEIA